MSYMSCYTQWSKKELCRDGINPFHHDSSFTSLYASTIRDFAIGSDRMRERQLRFYGHVVRFPMEDPAHCIITAKDPVEWNRRRGRPNSSWLAQLGDHMKE